MIEQKNVKEKQSLSSLLSDLTEETETLFRQEVALAKAELTENAERVGKNIGYLAVGGAVGFAALLAIMASVIAGLTYFIPLWLSALLVGLIIGIAAVLLIYSALNTLKKAEIVPDETVESLKEDAQWLKKQVS